MWSFVGSKNNKQWLWLAIDIETKEIVAFSLGERGEKGANQLWNSLPGIYSNPILVATDIIVRITDLRKRQKMNIIDKLDDFINQKKELTEIKIV